MKLPRLRPRPMTVTTESPPETAEPTSVSPAVPAFQVEAYSKSGLPDDEFGAQTEALRRILSYDGETRSWYGWLPFDHPERAAEVLTSLFEVARVHGTTIRVRAQPGGDESQSGQVAGTP